MKKLITSFLLSVVCCLFVEAQTNEDYYAPISKETVADKVSATITAGTGVSFMNTSKNAVMSTFVAPQIGYKLSPKWSLNVAMLHATMSGNPSLLNTSDNRYNSKQSNFNAASLGFEYKISNKASIGISTTIGNGNSNFNMNPAGRSFSNSMYPLGVFSPFGR